MGQFANYDGLIEAAAAFHPWDAMAPSALFGIVERGRGRPFSASAETGCGGSTIVLSRVSRHHTVFAIEGEHQTITELSQRPDVARGRVVFVPGQTKDTIPGHRFPDELDLVLLDGPHAYPLPQIEYAYLFPHLKRDGWLVIDDIQIPSVHALFRFLRKEPSVELEDVVVRTAFFRKTGDPATDAGPDGWWCQGMNRHLVLRYSWRDRLRQALFKRRR
jgi:hypothetical protein